MANDVVFGEVWHENQNYQVQSVRMEDMSFSTYGVVNRVTGVIEQVQPNLYNAKMIADQFNRWLTTGPEDEDDIEKVASTLDMFKSHGRSN